jgi:hypothetical protein
MISEIGAEAQLAVQAWRDQTKQAEIDPNSRLSDLAPALARLIGWLCEPETCERRGMRITAFAEVVRPDFNGEKSLAALSHTSKRNLDKLITDFRQTFRTSDSGKE